MAPSDRRPEAPGVPGVHLQRPIEERRALPPEPPSSPQTVDALKSERRSIFARPEVSLSTLWAAATRWSPAGIAAALVLVFLALGGREGVVALVSGLSESLSGARALTVEMAALRTEMEKLREEMAVERTQRQTVAAEVTRTQHNLSLVCDLASQLNHGRPNETWCSTDGRATTFDSPPAGSDRIPLWTTAARWQYRPPP